MSGSVWRLISATVIGTSHVAAGSECQDRHLCKEIQTPYGPVLLLLVSDGAGSAAKSAVGAQLVCEVLQDQALQFFSEEGEVDHVNARLIANWIQLFRDEIILQADSDGISEREYACTLLGAIIGLHSAALFQVGDGAIVYSTANGPAHSLAFWPERGEYENTTYFVTQASFFDQLQFAHIQETITDVALLSDGLQRLALDYQMKVAHRPFFSGLFSPMRAAEPHSLPSLNGHLTTFLNSAKVNERTDDDKTLVLAVSSMGKPCSIPEKELR